MAEQTRQEINSGAKLLKVKLNDQQIIERVTAVRDNAPDASLIVDANEAWSLELLANCHQQLAALGVEMIEQPLPAGQDDGLLEFTSAVPLCADESCHTRAELAHCVGRYQMVNIKLDKSGGLTEALALAKAAKKYNLELMVGCMVGSSLAMQPALLLADQARFVDLDGPLWLANDYQPALRIEQGMIYL